MFLGSCTVAVFMMDCCAFEAAAFLLLPQSLNSATQQYELTVPPIDKQPEQTLEVKGEMAQSGRIEETESTKGQVRGLFRVLWLQCGRVDISNSETVFQFNFIYTVASRGFLL